MQTGLSLVRIGPQTNTYRGYILIYVKMNQMLITQDRIKSMIYLPFLMFALVTLTYSDLFKTRILMIRNGSLRNLYRALKAVTQVPCLLLPCHDFKFQISASGNWKIPGSCNAFFSSRHSPL